jgi:hypothetical protein
MGPLQIAIKQVVWIARPEGAARTAGLLPLAVLAAVAVATPARLFGTKPLLLRWLHVCHVLPVFAQHAAAVHLATKALERAVDRFVSSYFNTNSQNKSPLEKVLFE